MYLINQVCYYKLNEDWAYPIYILSIAVNERALLKYIL